MQNIEQWKPLMTAADKTDAGAEYDLRRSLEMEFPAIYELRSEGYSLDQINILFSKKSGFKIKTSNLQTFYNEFLIKKALEITVDWKIMLQEACPQNLLTAPASPPALSDVYCLPLKPGVKKLQPRKGVDQAVYEEGEMEHPAIPRLMLSLAERLHWDQLEIKHPHGDRRETSGERISRVKWKKPIPLTPSTTMGDFVDINPKYFKGGTG